MVITGYDSVFLYVQLVSILSDHIFQANFVQFDDDFTGLGAVVGKLPERICQDSRQYIGDLLMWKERLTKKLETAKSKPVFYIVAADVEALYHSLHRNTDKSS